MPTAAVPSTTITSMPTSKYPNLEKTFPSQEPITQPIPMPAYRSFAEKSVLGNAANQQVATQAAIDMQRRDAQKRMRSMYEQLLVSGTKGADKIYQSALETYKNDKDTQGQGIDAWIPPRELFYDQETGQFLPHQYYQAINTGVQKFRQDVEKAKTISGEQRQREIIAGAPSDAVRSEVVSNTFAVAPQTPIAKDVQSAWGAFKSVNDDLNRSNALKRQHISATSKRTTDNLPAIQKNTRDQQKLAQDLGKNLILYNSAIEKLNQGQAIGDILNGKLKAEGLTDMDITLENLSAIKDKTKNEYDIALRSAKVSAAAELVAAETPNVPYSETFRVAPKIVDQNISKQASEIAEKIKNDGVNISSYEGVSGLMSKSPAYPWLEGYDQDAISLAIKSLGGDVDMVKPLPVPPPPKPTFGQKVAGAFNKVTETISKPSYGYQQPQQSAPIIQNNVAREAAIANLKAAGKSQEIIDAYIARKFGN
jgi:hypothetical protein